MNGHACRSIRAARESLPEPVSCELHTAHEALVSRVVSRLRTQLSVVSGYCDCCNAAALAWTKEPRCAHFAPLASLGSLPPSLSIRCVVRRFGHSFWTDLRADLRTDLRTDLGSLWESSDITFLCGCVSVSVCGALFLVHVIYIFDHWCGWRGRGWPSAITRHATRRRRSTQRYASTQELNRRRSA